MKHKGKVMKKTHTNLMLEKYFKPYKVIPISCSIEGEVDIHTPCNPPRNVLLI